MVVDTNKENLSINKLVNEKEEMIFVEEEMIVPDSKPDILSAISTSGNICTYKKELMNEKIKLDGNINAYIMYISDSAQDIARGININLDFSKMIDVPNCKENMILDMTTEIKNIECNVINGRKFNIKAEIIAKIKVYSTESLEVISEIINNEDIQVLNNNIKVNSLVGYGKTKAYVKDTIMIDSADNLAEILKININMVDRDIKTSYNKVLAKTEAEIKIMYLTEDNRIVKCINRIPIVGFIDIKNVSEENICDTNFEIRNMLIKPNNIEEHSIYIELEVEVFCMAYEEKELNLMQDLYSPVQELKCEKKKFNIISNKQNRKDICHINETVNLHELREGELIDADCMPRITTVSKLNSQILYEGEVEVDFVILSIESHINTSRVVIPFEFSMEPFEHGEMLDIATLLEMESQNLIVKTGGDVILDADIAFNSNICNRVELNLIDNIELMDNRYTEDYSLIIYIVKSGDTLWNIAKKLNSTVDDIVRANGLKDENLINVGEKLYVPKYTKGGVRKQDDASTIMSYA